MKKWIALAAAVVVVAILVTLPGCQTKSASHLLQLNLEKGKTYEYEIVQDQQQEMMEQKSEIRLNAAYLMDVVDVKEGRQTVKVTYKRFKMYMKIMDFVLDIDTDKPVAPPTGEEVRENPLGMMSAIFSGIRDKSFMMDLDKQGKVLSVTGFESIIRDMVSPLQLDENTRLQVDASLKDQFNEESIKDQFTPFFQIFPGKEIRTGDSWQTSWKTGGRMPSSYMTNYTVRDIDGDHVDLLSETKISSDKKEMRINGTQKGPLLIDSKTGLVIKADFNQEIEAVYQNMKISVKTKAAIKGKTL
jgi:hypothetical protein